jgi:hypothetical protein
LQGDQMLKLLTEAPSEPYRTRLDFYGGDGKDSDVPSLRLPIGGIASSGSCARAGIITQLLLDLGNDITHPSNVDEHVSLEGLRRHVAQRILQTCLERELSSQGDEGSYFTRSLIDLAVIGQTMKTAQGRFWCL